MMLLRYFLTIVAVLGLNTALFAQKRMERRSCDQEQADPRCRSMNHSVPDCALTDQMPTAYNMSARIDPNGSYDVSLDASFIYWNVAQDYMDVGRTALFFVAGNLATPAPDASVLVHPFRYQPGFKVGVGVGSDFDNWQFNAEYTFLHESSVKNFGSTALSFPAGSEVIVPNEWFINLSTDHQEQMGRMTSKWKMKLDMVDALLSRPFYQGQRVNVSPYAGLRALWLRQSFKIDANFARSLAAQHAISDNFSQGWALGPNFGSNMNWILGSGFRVEANAGMSLLYMRYTTLAHTESFPTTITVEPPVNGHAPARGYLRVINELGLGFGWGTYIYSKRFHVDFSARYDFSIFWSQNMMRQTVGFLANNSIGYSNPIGDLYLHGMTLTGRFDF